MRPDTKPGQILPHPDYQPIFVVFPQAPVGAIAAQHMPDLSCGIAADQQGRPEGGRP